MCKVLRRLFVLALLGGAGCAVYTAVRSRRGEPEGDAPAWPPIDDAARAPSAAPATAGFADLGGQDDQTADAGDPSGDADDTATSSGAADDDSAGADDTADVDDTASGSGAADDDSAGADDTADAPSGRRWADPVDGQCPEGYPIKGNDDSGIYHVPGGRFYDRTVPERCYANEEDAVADGYRRSKA